MHATFAHALVWEEINDDFTSVVKEAAINAGILGTERELAELQHLHSLRAASSASGDW